MTFSIDSSEVTELARSLTASVATLAPGASAVMSKAGLNVKRDAAQRVSGLAHAPAYPSSINYEGPKATLGAVEVEIGPTVGGPQWGLGDILEYGTPNSAPHPHLMPAAEKESPKVEKFLLEAALKGL